MTFKAALQSHCAWCIFVNKAVCQLTLIVVQIGLTVLLGIAS